MPHSSSLTVPDPASSSSSSSSGSSSEDDGPEQQATVSELCKRKRQSKKLGHHQGKRAKEVTEKDEFSPYCTFMSWHMRSQSIFVNFFDVLDYGIWWEDKKYGKHMKEQ
ncbi:hypothetical protein CPB84DRAFT_1749430 [Gymnopilus junonius]|uniref:Uncharacterized protein n=1 Tax=Gymnopilus junonius TaxID=109634 RepID=A0A9P5NG61_GYMJU|nr:hypothetical protein CPB84DRAFT_1749430 [Gymnopilus junonius]